MSGMSFSINLVYIFRAGSIIAARPTLNRVWKLATWRAASGSRRVIRVLIHGRTGSSIHAPTIRTSRLPIEIRRAIGLVRFPSITGLMEVPILAPRIRARAVSGVMVLLVAKVETSITVATEEWLSQVMTAPSRIAAISCEPIEARTAVNSAL